jgi:hypothetical protein
VIVTQVVPFPGDESVPAVKSYRAALAALGGDNKPGFVSLEGYLVGRTVISVLGKIDGAPTRANFVETVTKTGAIDLGGLTLHYGSGDNQGLDTVYLTVLGADGKYQPVTALK